MNTLATTGQSMDTQGATGWPMNSQDITGRPMDTQATTGWPIGTQPTTGWQMDSSSGSSGDSSDQDQVFQHENIFRVDRRKIESLMLGQFEPIKESAGDYFLRIGNQTGTTVVWPARLRVGAKKGKNPHITISGLKYQGVMEAKKIILEHFDCTLTNTITLKMDVSYNGHSYIIGKGGKTVNSVMSETGCHIHFPDSNRTNPNEKNNQVSITGDVEGIEKSRAKVRELVPLALTFDFIDVNFNANDPIFRAIQDKFNIKLMFLPKANYPDTSMAVIKGCELEASNVKEATQLLFDHISCSTGHTVSVTMNMEISPNHHSFVVGQNNSNLCFIMQSTNTKILFPDAADLTILPIKKGSVSITGNIEDVYAAHQQLVGSLPLSMSFDAPNGFQIPIYELHEIMEDLHVDISIRPKKSQGSKSVLIKTQERNASAIYAARFRLLKSKDLDQFVIANIPESYKIQPNPSDLLQSGSDFNQEKVSRFDSSTDSGSDDEFNANQYPCSPTLSPTSPSFYQAPLVSNRLPVFIAITSKLNKVTC